MGSLARNRRFLSREPVVERSDATGHHPHHPPHPGGVPAQSRPRRWHPCRDGVVTFAWVPGGVVASLLDHRLQAGKPPASWQMDAGVTWDEATRAHAAVAHPLPSRVGTPPAATHLLGDRELPYSLREDLGPPPIPAREVLACPVLAPRGPPEFGTCRHSPRLGVLA